MSGTDRASKAPNTHNQSIQAATMTTEEPETIEKKTFTKHGRNDSNPDAFTPTPKSIRSRSTTPHDYIPPRKHNSRHVSSRATSSTRTTPSGSSSLHTTTTTTTTPQSSRPPSSHCALSRHSSISASAIHPSRHSSRPPSSHYTHTSRRSSLSVSTRHNPTRHSSYPTTIQRPLLPHRDAWGSYIHLHENPFLPHHKSKSKNGGEGVVRTFTTFETFPDTFSTANLRSPSLPVFPTAFPLSHDDDDGEMGAGVGTRPTTHPRSYSNYFPATTIDWKLPATRRREYEAIERNCRGMRGLWMRVVPRWCRSRGREVEFWDGGDGGSVRRYRVDAQGEEKSVRDSGRKKKGAWWRRKQL